MPFILYLLTIIIALQSCDKIDYPVVKKDLVKGSSFILKNNTAYSNSKKILLEDYTGHTCGNCPPAAEIAEQLSGVYGQSLVVMAVHAGFFARIKVPDYPVTYTTVTGNDWDGSSGFGVSAVGNPNGMVNRKVFNSGRIQKESNWGALVSTTLKEPFVLKLDAYTEYDTSLRALNASVKATFKSAYPNPTRLCLVLTEDQIIGSQTDYRKSPDLNPTYEFNHVLRGALNGSWGSVLRSGSVLAGDTARVSSKDFKVNSSFKDRHLALVAIAFDELTREVLQVDKLKIRD